MGLIYQGRKTLGLESRKLWDLDFRKFSANGSAGRKFKFCVKVSMFAF